MTQTSNSGIPFEIDGAVIYLNPNSAQGKALQRIMNPIPEDEWITIKEIGEDIDWETVTQRLNQRGYKVQISDQDSSLGQL